MGARGRRWCRRLSVLDQKTGEVVNVQPRYVGFEVVSDGLGFLGVDLPQRGGLMFLHEGEVLIDWRGEGTIQVHPEVFDSCGVRW